MARFAAAAMAQQSRYSEITTGRIRPRVVKTVFSVLFGLGLAASPGLPRAIAAEPSVLPNEAGIGPLRWQMSLNEVRQLTGGRVGNACKHGYGPTKEALLSYRDLVCQTVEFQTSLGGQPVEVVLNFSPKGLAFAILSPPTRADDNLSMVDGVAACSAMLRVLRNALGFAEEKHDNDFADDRTIARSSFAWEQGATDTWLYCEIIPGNGTAYAVMQATDRAYQRAQQARELERARGGTSR